MKRSDLAAKLDLVLKALVLSRAGLASALNVDKSLVGRWVAGTVTPSEHNLAHLTRYIASRIDGFTLLDWERTPEDFERLLGVGLPGSTVSANFTSLIPSALLDEAVRATQLRGAAYEGLWRGTRASSDLPGRFVHDIVMIQCRDDGLIRFCVGVEGVRYEGFSLLLQNQLFSIATDISHGTMMFSIFNGVARQRPEVLDGLNLATLRDAGGSPAASPSLIERIGDLSGDRGEDERRFEAAIAALVPLAPEGSIPEAMARHLTTSVSDAAPGIMRLLFGRSMARGSLLESGKTA